MTPTAEPPGLRLHPEGLGTLPVHTDRFRYDRRQLKPRIVHLGLGAFARAHLAVATEAALQATPGPFGPSDGDWGLRGVSLRQPDVRHALAPQQGLYCVAVRDADADGTARERRQVIGCVLGVDVAPESPQAVLEAVASPVTRIVSLTVTEKGYLRDPASGELQRQHPDIQHDLRHPDAPRTAPGFIVHALNRRRQRGLGPLTLMSMDNLPSNGRSLRQVVVALAQQIDPGLARWIADQCSFPNSMVDRIVPRTTESDRRDIGAALRVHDAAAVVTEPFFDWVVEDQFVAGRPAWEAAGVRFVSDAAPWEQLKLRMVNGCHSAIAYLGVMAGWATVDQAVAQPPLQRFLVALMAQEIEPTLPVLPGLEVPEYRRRLLARFANPALAHQTRQIAMDGSQKLPQRLLATAQDRLARGASVRHLALAIAAWLHHLRGHDEAGQPYRIDDPLAAALQALHAEADRLTDPLDRARTWIGFTPVFGDLAHHPALANAIAAPLESLRTRGVAATLADAV